MNSEQHPANQSSTSQPQNQDQSNSSNQETTSEDQINDESLLKLNKFRNPQDAFDYLQAVVYRVTKVPLDLHKDEIGTVLFKCAVAFMELEGRVLFMEKDRKMSKNKVKLIGV